MSNLSWNAVQGPVGLERVGHDDAVVGAYPLTPMQHAMLLRSQRDPRGGFYVQQFICTLREPLHVPELRRAWRRLAARHAVLRTSFHLDATPEPVQRVCPAVELPWSEHDWRPLDCDAREAALQAFLRDDRATGFRADEAPLARLALIRMADEEYRLVWTSHHALIDGHARRILLREVFEDYQACVDGRDFSATERRSFGEYVRWVEQAEPPDSRAFWEEALRGFESPNEFVPQGDGGEGESRERHRFVLSGELTAALKALAERRAVTLNTVLQAAWALLLGRYTGDRDVVFGAPRSCRRSGFEGADGVVGLLTNTVPLRVRLDMGRSVAAHLEALRALWVRIRPHERTYLARVQESSDVPAGVPLFQTMLGFETESVEGALRGLGGEWRHRGFDLLQSISYPLAVLARGGDTLSFEIVYDPARLSAAAAGRIGQHLAAILRAFAADPRQPLGRVEILSAGERRHLADELNPPAAPYAGPACIHSLIQAQASRTPDAVALSFEGQTLTHGELDRRSNQLARALRARGVGPEARVGVCMERSLELVIALVAIFKAGGAYVPLDPDYPEDRLRYVLGDAGVSLVLCQAHLADRLPSAAAAPMIAAPLWAQAEGESAAAIDGPEDPDGLAYVIYTSGSTGQPKGAMNAHRGVANRLLWMREVHGLDASDTVLQKTPYSFDVSVWEFFWPLVAGARLVLARPGGHRDPAYLREVLRREAISTVHFVPSMLAAFLEADGSDGADVSNGADKSDPSNGSDALDGSNGLALRRVVCSGEALSYELQERFFARFPAVALHNLYGPTEAAVDVTFWACRPGDARRTVPIGRPVANTRCYVLNARGELVPPSVAGELYLGGAQVGRGYLGRPGLTAERFVPDPFSPRPGARMYRTGDRARWLADGALDYLGRVDQQVKIRGFRVEPGEIEAALREHPGVRDAVVDARRVAPGDTRLVAYVVPSTEAVPPAELRTYLAGRLPAHMVPSLFVALDALPLTPSGKLSRRSLPDPELGGSGDPHDAPCTPAEEVLAGLFAGVLGVERVGVRDDFFALGGHSLLATRLAVRVREALGVDLPLHALFDAPSVGALAGVVAGLRAAGQGVPEAPPVRPVARDGALPLSFAQERLWFIHRLDPASAAYNIPVFLRLGGPLDAAALERALGEVVRRHEALRTVFAEADGAPVQVIQPYRGVTLALHDLSTLPAEARDAEVKRRAAEEAARPFDLSAGPVLRAALLRLGVDDHVLLLTVHHVAGDGLSLDVLFREVAALYAGYREGRDASLAELPVQYADFAVWQREHLRGPVLERQLAYWRERLRGAPELLELPADRPRPPAPSYRGATVPVALPAGLLEGLRALGRREGATLYMVLLGAFQVLLGRHAGSDDVVVGSPIAGRTRPEVEGLVGFFVNTLVLRADLSGDPSFGELLRRVREAALGAYEHQEVPFEKLVAELQPGRSLSHSPLFQVSFALEDAGSGGRDLPGLTVSPVDTGAATAKFDLSLRLEVTPHGLRGGLTYATDLFERGTIERMAGHLERVLEQAAADPGRRLSALALMGPAERARVVEGWRRMDAVPSSPDTSIHGRFERRARQAPGAVAVVRGKTSLTYGQLDERADRLARALRRRGVGPEVRVGLCLERSTDTVAAILGVLKAGGAYVPIDPAYPADRIAYLLEDSGVALVLVEDGTPPAVPASTASVLTLGELLASVDEADDERPVDVDPRNAAYVIYTSGSTGRPKGVVVTHANVLRLFDATEPWFGFGASDVWTLFHSYAFDFSVWEIWGALLYGGRLVVVPWLVSRSPADFRLLLASEGVTVLNQTPSAFRQLARADEEAGAAGGTLALRWVIFGGEALEPRSLAPWFARHGDRRPRLVNMYGITETTVHVTFRPLSRGDAEAGGSMIGEAIPDLGVYLLDGRGEPVPPGVGGEIFVGGAGAARGYLGRPGLTAERFVPDPFAGVAGARMYRSGDRGRMRAGGDVEYLGRGDQQVKVRGFRIEPGEIEAALVAQPGVREAVVIAREDEPGVRRLVAYVVPADADLPTADVLRAALAARLPDYMVPSAIVPLDRVPLTPHGKVDRHALPAPDGGAPAEAYVAPSGPVEEALARAWAETLGVERVGAHDNYFALGGDSMRAIQALALARARGVPFSLPDLFRYQTVAELAARIGGVGSVGADGDAEAGAGPFSLLAAEDRDRVPAGVEDAYPMTRLQLGMLFHTEHRPRHAVYHNVQVYRVEAAFDEARMRRALAALAARHPVLRTSFDLAGFAEPVQLVHARVELPLSITDVSALAAEARDAAMEAWVAAERARAFDWRVAPLIRFHVHLLAPDAFRLGFTEHHAILDGWSVAALVGELLALYAGAPRAADDAPPASVLREFVALERDVVARAEARGFWAEALEGAEPTLPASLGAGGGEGNRIRRVAVSAEVAGGLGDIARREGLPLKSLLLAAHLRVLAAASGAGDVTTGVVVNGRPEGARAERALGLFLNTVACRVRLGGGSWLALAREAFEWERRMLPFRRFPVAELQRMRGGHPPFEALFNFIHFHQPDSVAAVREGRALAGARGVSGTNFPFAASFEVAPEGLLVSLEYDAARYADADAETLLGRYLSALAHMAGDAAGRHGAATLLTAAERARVDGWSAGETVAASAHAAGTVHAQVSLQAARSPDAPAVSADGGTLTFAELERDSRRLAAFLRARGVGPETRVGVCLERSAELPVALLAVLRAGAAYVPLDPEHPAERLRWMLGDSGAPLLLTQGALAGRFAGWGGEVVALDEAAGRIAAERADGDDVAAEPESLAYVIYTSGSTGRPKGVGVTHRAIANHMAWMRRAFPLQADDRVLQKTPAGFDASVWEFWAPLMAGATLVMAPPGAHRDPAALLRAVARERITVLQMVPSVLRAVLDEPGLAACGTLRRLFCGGEALPAELAARARAATGARVINLYGPTEACIDAASHVFAGGSSADAGATVPIGRPVDNLRAHVLDGAGNPVAPGVPGELYLGGAQLARGYPGRPGLTAERFVPDLFATDRGARLYRTGDRARWLGDGTLEYLGRVDQQVKVRGVRVEPAEVEAVLGGHPGVSGCAVEARAGAGGDTRLVAYVVPAPGAAPDAGGLRAHLRERLPESMVPSLFVVLGALPLTPSGKLDRRALPAPDAARDQGDIPVAPRDALELRLAQLWEGLLGAGPVGVRDDFFALGGHSLLALRLLAAVERLTGRRVPMATLLAAPTVEQLARALRADAPLAHGPLVPIRPAGNGRPLFLVHAAGGNAVSYAALARHLGAGIPVYAFQSRGLEGGEIPHARIEAMAADYLAELRAVQPVGPYRLGGWSMGGVVAFEMARELEAAGETVELLAVIDSRAPGSGSGALDGNDPALLDHFVLHLGLAPERIAHHPAGEATPVDPGERLRRAWEAARAAGVVPDGLPLDQFERLWAVFRANVSAAAGYRPRPCAADLLLVVAENRAALAEVEAARWKALTTGRVRSAVLPGDHFGIVREPHVRELAARLGRALDSERRGRTKDERRGNRRGRPIVRLR